MNPKLSAALAIVILGASSLSAQAQPQPQPGRPGAGPQSGPSMQPQAPRQAPAAQHPHAQPPHAPAHAPRAVPQPPLGNPPPRHMQERHGAGPDHRWNKGSRMPAQYRSQHYVVKDWQHHGLKRPGRGQQWVQNGNDYLLVAVASGVIAQIVFGH